MGPKYDRMDQLAVPGETRTIAAAVSDAVERNFWNRILLNHANIPPLVEGGQDNPGSFRIGPVPARGSIIARRIKSAGDFY